MADEVNSPDADRPRWGCAILVAELLLGAVVGGLTTRDMALSKTWLKAGLPVTVSETGKAIFLALGCLAGLACVAVCHNLVCLYLDGRGTLWKWRTGWRAGLLVLLAAVEGLVAGVGASAVSNFVVPTMPDELFDVITDEIPVEVTCWRCSPTIEANCRPAG